jgi:hypothetical protein
VRSLSRLAVGFATISLLASSVWTAALAAQSGRVASSRYFRGPGGNVVCGYFSGAGLPQLLECGVAAQLSPPPPRPSTRGCGGLDFAGNRIRLDATGPAFGFCSGDAGVLAELHSAPRLASGATWHEGSFTCTVSVAWVSCSNTSRHGFAIDRYRWRSH